MKTSIFAVIAVVLVALAVVLLWYLRKSMLFSKGNYGKKTVKSILNRYAISRNYKVLENVQDVYKRQPLPKALPIRQ